MEFASWSVHPLFAGAVTACLGIASALGAFGGFFIPKSYGTALALTGAAQPALYAFIVFYLSCIALTWRCYLRRRGASPDVRSLA